MYKGYILNGDLAGHTVKSEFSVIRLPYPQPIPIEAIVRNTNVPEAEIRQSVYVYKEFTVPPNRTFSFWVVQGTSEDIYERLAKNNLRSQGIL